MVQARHPDRYLWHALRAKCAPHRLDGWCRGRWNHQSRRCSTREGWPWATTVFWKKCAFRNSIFLVQRDLNQNPSVSRLFVAPEGRVNPGVAIDGKRIRKRYGKTMGAV